MFCIVVHHILLLEIIVEQIAVHRSPERVVAILALRHETIVAHVIHAREQVAFLPITLREWHPSHHSIMRPCCFPYYLISLFVTRLSSFS